MWHVTWEMMILSVLYLRSPSSVVSFPKTRLMLSSTPLSVARACSSSRSKPPAKLAVETTSVAILRILISASVVPSAAAEPPQISQN